MFSLFEHLHISAFTAWLNDILPLFTIDRCCLGHSLAVLRNWKTKSAFSKTAEILRVYRIDSVLRQNKIAQWCIDLLGLCFTSVSIDRIVLSKTKTKKRKKLLTVHPLIWFTWFHCSFFRFCVNDLYVVCRRLS